LIGLSKTIISMIERNDLVTLCASKHNRPFSPYVRQRTEIPLAWH
jgi:hypothetical protein